MLSHARTLARNGASPITSRVIDVARNRDQAFRHAAHGGRARKMESPMNAHKDIVDRYLAIWNETDPARRRALIAGAWTEDATYVDPVMRGAGHAGIDAMIAGAQAQFPGFAFRPLGEPDGHNDRLRFRWTLGPAGGATIIDGVDFAVLAPDGRIASVSGFLDRVPA
jgi:hypothetical protein